MTYLIEGTFVEASYKGNDPFVLDKRMFFIDEYEEALKHLRHIPDEEDPYKYRGFLISSYSEILSERPS